MHPPGSIGAAQGVVEPRRRESSQTLQAHGRELGPGFDRAQPFIPLSLEFFPWAFRVRIPPSQAAGTTLQGSHLAGAQLSASAGVR